MNKPLFFFLALLTLAACRPDAGRTLNLYKLAAFTDRGIQVVVEIPAGTNQKIEYSTREGRFVIDRTVEFLPYPGNYGFVPSTLMDKKQGGDGDPVDVLVISESVPTGTVMEVRAIGALIMKDRGEMDTKIIAIPIDSALQIIRPRDYVDFAVRHQAAHELIERWFLTYKGPGIVEFIAWRNESYALDLIQQSVLVE